MNQYAQVDSMRESWLNPVDQEPDTIELCCVGCGNSFKPYSDDIEDFCSESCWHLHRLGEVKAQILLWKRTGADEKKIIRMMKLYWFYWMTDSTVKRWKRAIHNIFEQGNNYAH